MGVGASPLCCVAAPSTLSYGSDSLKLRLNVFKSIPLSTGSVFGSPDTANFTVLPALPAGLHITAADGTIFGTPTALSAVTSYTVYANNSIGGTSVSISVTVDGESG